MLLKIIDQNEEKALQHVANKYNQTKEEVENDHNAIVFSNPQEIIEYMYTDVNGNMDIYILDELQYITQEKMKEYNADNVTEYLIKTWGHLEQTPYGYVKYDS